MTMSNDDFRTARSAITDQWVHRLGELVAGQAAELEELRTSKANQISASSTSAGVTTEAHHAMVVQIHHSHERARSTAVVHARNAMGELMLWHAEALKALETRFQAEQGAAVEAQFTADPAQRP